MGRSKKSMKAPVLQTPVHRNIWILGPKPVEEEEESSESDFDPPPPLALVSKNKNAKSQAGEDQDSESDVHQENVKLLSLALWYLFSLNMN